MIEIRYQDALQKLMDMFAKSLPFLNITNSADILREFRHFCDNDNFYDYVTAVATRMVTGLRVDSARTWREAASRGMEGRRIYDLLNEELMTAVGAEMRAIVEKNADLISTFDRVVAREVNSYVMQEMKKGRRSEAITKDLVEQFPDVTRSRIALIARTETSKASTALTKARSFDLGLDWYVWRTSKDARVRDSHRIMDRVLVSWNDPASPETLAHEKRTYGNYNPGEIFNCRCYPEPVITLNLIKWPAKVYRAGRIQYMTRAQFEQINYGRKAA